MSTPITDENVFEQMQAMVSSEGADWAENYEMFLADNRTFEPYWDQGVEAIRTNTVDDFVFGRECMIAVGRKHLEANTFDADNVLDDLAIAMDRAVAALARKKPLAVNQDGP